MNAQAGYLNLSPPSMLVGLLQDFARLAQEKDQRQLIKGYALKIAAKLSCKHCGKRLGPGNKSGYCTEHHRPCDRVEKRLCVVCGKRLRSDAPKDTDRCLQCRLPSVELHFCKAVVNGEKCGNRLYANNTTGLCVIHRHLSRYPGAWKPCKEPGCPNCVESTNEQGYCREHRYANHRPSVTGRPLRYCTRCVELGDSAPPLALDNESGLCKRHLHLKYRPLVERKTCRAAEIIGPGNECTAVLGANNESGLCAVHFMAFYGADPEHRAAAARRQQDFRARQEKQRAEAKAKAEAAQAAVTAAQAEIDRLTREKASTVEKLAEAEAKLAAAKADQEKLAKILAGGSEKHTKDIQDREYFTTGRRVESARHLFNRVYTTLPRRKERTRERLKAEGFGLTPEQIDAILTSKNALVATRQFIASVTNLEYQTVAEYHKKYTKELQPSLPLPSREAS